MKDTRPRLPKDVASIFKGAELPQEVTRRCPSRPSPAAGARRPEPLALAAKADAAPAQGAPRMCPVKDVQIELLMKTVPCAKDYGCYRSGFETLCKARSLLGGRVLECLERGPSCSHRFSLLGRAVCRCGIRRHIMGRLGR